MEELKSTMSVVIYSSVGVWRPANRGVLRTASNALFELAGVGRDGDLNGSRQNLRRRAPNACCLVVFSPYCVIRLFILFSFNLQALRSYGTARTYVCQRKPSRWVLFELYTLL
jgi:hypothetical protein